MILPEKIIGYYTYAWPTQGNQLPEGEKKLFVYVVANVQIQLMYTLAS